MDIEHYISQSFRNAMFDGEDAQSRARFLALISGIEKVYGGVYLAFTFNALVTYACCLQERRLRDSILARILMLKMRWPML